MQNPSRPQPLTLSHVIRPEETWSSDSDSGITVDSHSPPSKTTPDSGIVIDQLSWNLPPPPPSLLSDDPPSCRMTSRASTTRGGVAVTSPEESEAERQRQQEYVRNTLLEYERQKMLEEERGSGFYSRDGVDLDRARCSSSPNMYANQGSILSHLSGPTGSDRHKDLTSHCVANDYVPSQMARKSRHPNQDQGDVSEGHPPVTYQDLHDRFSGEFFPPGDEGYGTDSRSNTTGSLGSPLSSSLSSLTTDSSSSLNGSQRGVGALGGSGSVRTQPVASSGRLVIGKRGMLVKRRDLPTVERTDAVTLEDRLRALTTIQEEESAASSTNCSQPTFPRNQRTEVGQDKTDNLRRPDSAVQDSGSRSGSGTSSEGQTYPEGLYSVITKRPNQLYSASSPRPLPRHHAEGGSDRASSENGDFNSSSLHRAVPVRVQPEGEDSLSPKSTSDSAELAGQSVSGSEKNSADSSTKSGKSEVRFKAGGGGVKLNDSGQFEIDYSYYMKASPSESNDEVNTYSLTPADAPFSEVFREGDMPPRRRSASHCKQVNFQSDEDSRYARWSDLNLYTKKDLSREAIDSEGYDQDYPSETEHLYMNVGAYSSALRQASLPNLTMHTPPHLRHHSGDAITRQEPQRHSQDGGSPPSFLRHNPAPVGGFPSSTTRQGDRNSCDVGSLYRQADLSHTFPPPTQGVAADRLSLNLGDLPRIQEQLRATSEMLLSSGKRHQFASSSDIYKLFQGQQQGGGFAQGRQPPHRRSFHDFTSSPPLHNLAEVRSRVKANASASNSTRPGMDQSQTATSPGFTSQGPIRANHNITVPDSVGYPRYGAGRDHVVSRPSRHVYSRDASAPPAGQREAVTLRERLDRGQQFATDVIQSEEGEQLSTLV